MEKINDYNFSRSKNNELGRGSFSIVYSGIYNGKDNKYIRFNSKVAIKIIKTDNLTSKAKEILEEEVSIMMMIKDNPHPNIVGCYDVLNNDKELFIIMEYCDSGDLRSILKKPIKEKYAQFYFCQLRNGLKYLDDNFIIHRDIKPKNILLTDNRRILKIADFGFAKRFEEQSLHETICGSPLYMAPEIMKDKMYTNKTDLWSIGMILYEMLYGLHPYGMCKTIPELKNKISVSQIDIPPQNTKNKDVSEPCLSLLKCLLQKEANNRITWNEFFEHPWVNAYQYINFNNKKNDEYETQLFSTSLGSINSIPKEDQSNLSSTPKYVNYNDILSNSNTPIVKMSHLENLVIMDDFCDKIEDSYESKSKLKESQKNNSNQIFEMDEDFLT